MDKHKSKDVSFKDCHVFESLSKQRMVFNEKEVDSTASSSTVNVTGAKAKRSQSLFMGQSGQLEKGQVFAFESSRGGPL